MTECIADNLARMRERIAEAAIRAGRRPEEVTLVAVSKTHPAEAVAAALAAGQERVRREPRAGGGGQVPRACAPLIPRCACT